jgi:lysophospholipase L1-like esterase
MAGIIGMKSRLAFTLTALLLALAAPHAFFVAPVAQQSVARKPVLYLIGDSTVNTPTRGQLGWGAPLPEFFDLTKISIENRARGGRSSRTYFSEGLWQEVFDKLQPGDFVLMQFGHNDGGPVNDNFRARGSIRGIGEETEEIDNLITKKHEIVHSYGWYLRRYISDAKAKGATAIVLSPVPRNNWKDGKIARASNDYGKWSSEVARQSGVPFIDLNDITARHYETFSPERVKAEYFTDADNTHTSPAGAVRNAASVVEGLRALAEGKLKDFLLARLVTESIVAANVAMQRRVDALPGSLVEIQRQFLNPPDDARIMMRWWWFGPAVTKAGIERELRQMKEAGIGGVEIQPVYPLALDDESKGLKNLRFLSPEFLDALKFANDKARELGLRVDLTLGSGWPFGGPMVPATQAASRLRVERVTTEQARVPLPKLGDGEEFIAAFVGQRELIEIKDGAIWLPAEQSQKSEVLFFISSRTRQQVKRAAYGSEGFVLNHYDRASLDNYLRNVGEPLLQAFGSNPPYAIFCDSLEVFSSDWTPDFLSEFQKRRGYDLKPLLPALVRDIGPQTSSIRHDWGQTLTELLNERFLAPLQQWAKQHNTKFRIQGYGIPPATIGSNANVDLTEGEGPHWKILRASRWASSANHLYGRNITSSETWTWLHSPSFRATPLDVKAEADLHFLQGINQLIGHGWPYTPEGVEYPGNRFYAAAVFDEKNPWWIAMPEVSKYLQRVSYLLRQGSPSNDVAFYLPNSDAWAGFVNPKVHYMIEALKDRLGEHAVAQVLEAGFNLDFFDDDVLRQLGKAEAGALTLGPNKYKAVVLPNVERLPLATLQTLEAFARQGGVVIAARRKPVMLPGYKTADAERAEFNALLQKLFEGEKPLAHFVADDQQLGSKLAVLTQPDVQLTPAVPGLGFIHRRTPEADIYFIANSTNERQSVSATLRVTNAQAEWWDPLDGSVVPLQAKFDARGATVPLSFAPYESRVLVFSKRHLPEMPMPMIVAMPPQLDLSNDWRVTIGQTIRSVGQLRSWTDDAATRFYSGTVTYEKDVTIDASLLPPKSRLPKWLSFGVGQAVPVQPRKNGMRAWFDGPVRDAAVVYVNDQRAGAVWCPPYSIDVTKLLKPGVNKLRIVVGNTAINYMAGQKQPDYKELNQRYGERFQPQDMENLQPLPSGLLGPVRLGVGPGN